MSSCPTCCLKKTSCLILDQSEADLSTPDWGKVLEECGKQKITPVAAISEQAHQRARIFSLGFEDYICRPFLTEEVATRLLGLMARRPRISSPASPQETAIANVAPSRQRLRFEGLVAATCAYLQLDLSAHHTLDHLARQMGTNRNTLAKAFREVLDTGVSEWFRDLRLRHAASLLAHSDQPIQEISFEVGFDTAANFSTAFRLHHGHSPRTYREMMRNSKLTVTASKDG